MEWYEVVEFGRESKFEQGDIITNCPFYDTHPDGKGGLETNVYRYDVVIMTQSCDLENGKTDKIFVAPWKPLQYHLDAFLAKQQRINPDKLMLTVKEKRNFFENLKNGIFYRYYILDKCPDCGLPEHPVIDFGNTYSVSLSELNRIAFDQNSIIRLKSPFKEHLSQAFARYFMRVGLPSTIQNPF